MVVSSTGSGRPAGVQIDELRLLSSMPGLGQYYIWGWDDLPALPIQAPAAGYEPKSHYPGPGGVRVTANVFADSSVEAWAQAPLDHETYERLLGSEPAGLVRGDTPKMHRTDTIDVGVVVHGNVVVEASDGSRTTLGPGDVYIQNGEMHAWHADPEAPALVVFVIVGARREDDSLAGSS